MAIEIMVPRLGWSMEEGVFGEWLKHEGENVDSGDMLFMLESDKAAQEVESLDTGILRIAPNAPEPGEAVLVGQLLGYLVEEGEPSPFESGDQTKQQVHTSHAALSATTDTPDDQIGTMMQPQVIATSKSSQRDSEGKQPGAAISPRARRLAQELGIEWSTLSGSGRNSRIREQDIRSAALELAEAGTPQANAEPSPSGTGKLLPITPTRQLIAERMLAGTIQAAPVTLTTKVDATNLANLRRQFKSAARSQEDIIPSYTDFIIKLASVALQQHPMLQAQWGEDGIFVPDQIHVAVAVDTEAGLLGPVLWDVGSLTLSQISGQSKTLVEQARSHQLKPEQMQGATFTITNLGKYGIDTFTPILNWPQASILGVGRIILEAVVVGTQIVPREMLSLSLTFDHRVVDGAPAARFLDTVRKCIEQPGPWLMP